ncbi:hypothetical protein [Cryptosporangium sp. NPDC051539]|uniref:hypothetical protein n=1 Tax=Cryptosporangium sp. NPDC051539 TaxID=3363962 RepID=UPI00378A722F
MRVRMMRLLPGLADATGRGLRLLPGVAGALLLSGAAWMLTPVAGLAVAGVFLLAVDWRLSR